MRLKSNAFDSPLYVTRPFLPPYEKFISSAKEIWENKILTNNGPILKRYKEKLANYLKNPKISLFSNGTQALQIALQVLGITGDVITTPFSFVATTHALFLNNLNPIFSDIEENYFTLDPKKIEQNLTPKTKAILAVHVFGHPCQHEQLLEIANKRGLYLIYDAAHAFDVKVNNVGIDKYGDISMFSFHATKNYHTFEGGMLSFKEKSYLKKLEYLKNFGFENETEVVMPGTNAKMNEMQALMGELMLDCLPDIKSKIKKIYLTYQKRLQDTKGVTMVRKVDSFIDYNYAFAPVRISSNDFGMTRDELYLELQKYNVFARRYFYPLICDFACYKNIKINDSLSVARKVSSEILTLPIYPDLKIDEVNQICDILEYLGAG